MRRRCWTFAAACVIGLLAAPPAFAIIPGQESDALFDQPGEFWSGMNWDYVYTLDSYNGVGIRDGTYVSIGYFYLLTARHFTTSPGDKLHVNGDEIEVVGIHYAPADPNQTLPPDLRVLKLRNNTNPFRPLPGYYPIYTGSLSRPNDYLVLVGTGYSGVGRSADYIQDKATGRVKRWGTNQWRNNERMQLLVNFNTSVFRMTYGQIDTKYEVGLAEGDSGGGAFVRAPGQSEWMLAGINLYREGGPTSGKDMWAAKLSDYADWIHARLAYDVLPGDTDGDGDVDAEDYLQVKLNLGTPAGASWAMGDFDGDHDVDGYDLFAIETNFGLTTTPHSFLDPAVLSAGAVGIDGAVPAPAGAALLAAGALGLLRRRRRRL